MASVVWPLTKLSQLQSGQMLVGTTAPLTRGSSSTMRPSGVRFVVPIASVVNLVLRTAVTDDIVTPLGAVVARETLTEAAAHVSAML
eukprot:7207092-Prymnesium_polylepis.1